MNYRAEVGSLLRMLQKADFELENVDDGGEVHLTLENHDAIDTIMSVDMSRLIVRHTYGRASLLIIIGNSPGELVADYFSNRSLSPILDKVVTCHSRCFET